MARTATGGFFPRGTISGRDYPAVWEFIIANSQTITIGDVVRLNTSGYIAIQTTTSQVPLGVCVGIVDRNGINVFSNRAIGLEGITSKTESGITVTSTNQSNDLRNIKVQVYLDHTSDMLWFNDADANLAQTNLLQNGSINVFTSGNHKLNVSGLSDVTDQTYILQLIKLDPDNDGDLSKGLFKLRNTQVSNEFSGITNIVA